MHVGLLDALAAGQVDEGEAALAVHLEAFLGRQVERLTLLENQPDYGVGPAGLLVEVRFGDGAPLVALGDVLQEIVLLGDFDFCDV